MAALLDRAYPDSVDGLRAQREPGDFSDAVGRTTVDTSHGAAV